MATYKQISQFVRKESGFVPKSCWIAHVLADHGLIKRVANNRVSPSERKHPCPNAKRAAIEKAVRHYSMI